MRNAAEVRAAESVEVLFGFFIPFNVKETLIKSRVGDHRSIVSSDVGDIQGSSPICGERSGICESVCSAYRNNGLISGSRDNSLLSSPRRRGSIFSEVVKMDSRSFTFHERE